MVNGSPSDEYDSRNPFMPDDHVFLGSIQNERFSISLAEVGEKMRGMRS